MVGSFSQTVKNFCVCGIVDITFFQNELVMNSSLATEEILNISFPFEQSAQNIYSLGDEGFFKSEVWHVEFGLKDNTMCHCLWKPCSECLDYNHNPSIMSLLMKDHSSH